MPEKNVRAKNFNANHVTRHADSMAKSPTVGAAVKKYGNVHQGSWIDPKNKKKTVTLDASTVHANRVVARGAGIGRKEKAIYDLNNDKDERIPQRVGTANRSYVQKTFGKDGPLSRKVTK
jgi:hypothetical protein